jgi:hypothetical protein
VSIEASSFVLGLSMGQGNGIRKLILLGYANHADKFGRGAYPSTRTIADYAECDVRTVQRHLRWLIERGYLHEGDHQMVDHLDPRYRPIVYDVAISPEQIQQWATGTGPETGSRARAAEAGRRGGHASSHLSRGDNLSPPPENESPQVGRGDNLSPLQTGSRGDNEGGSEATNREPRGDSRVTRTVLEPSTEPSSSPLQRGDACAAAQSPPGGGHDDPPSADALDVLPESVRAHPSVVPTAIDRRVQALERHGWPRAQIRTRLVGIETAHAPGAAALARLASLTGHNPPATPRARPRWCGVCDQRTRMREDTDHDDRPYPCPECHPRTTPEPSTQAVRQGATGSAAVDKP